MNPDPNAPRPPTPRRFVSITRTVHSSRDGYFLDAIADDGTAWYCLYSPLLAPCEVGWKQHGALPPIS